MGIMLILVVSILLQFVAAILALRLIRITGRRIGWAMIAAAVTLMALRRCITLFNFLSGGTAPDLQSEWVALAASVLTAAGVGAIGPLFVSMKQSKDALRESERTYATLFSNLPGMVYRCRNDKDWSAEFVSEGIYALTGYLPSDFTEGKIAFGSLIHPDDREAVWNNIQEALKERRPYRLTYRIRPASGEEKWLSEQGQGIFSPSEELLYLEGFVTDVTEQKRAEEALRGSEARFNAFMENSPITAFIKNEEGRLLYINSTFERTFELQNVDWRGKTDSELWPPETAQMLRANDVAILFSGETRPVEEDMPHADGAHHWLTYKFRFTDSAGHLYLGGMGIDQTERKRVEAALRNAKEFSENLIQTANVIILSLDNEGNIDIFNQTAEKITGYTLSELKGKNWFETLTPKDRYPHVWEEFARLMAGGMPKTFENPILTKSGEERYIIWQNNPVKVDGKVVANISFGNDITERKQTEEALHANRELLNNIIDSTPSYIFASDLKNRYVLVNNAVTRLLGASKEELLGKTEHDFFPKDLADRLQAINKQIMETGTPLQTEEVVAGKKGGGPRVVMTIKFPLRDAQGKIRGLGGVATDITERKQAEEALRESEQMNREQYAELHQLYQTAPVGLALVDHELRFVRINDRLAEINGRPAEQQIGRAISEVLPQLWPSLEPIYRRVMSGEPVLDVQIHGVTPAQPGAERDWVASYYPVLGDDGFVRGVSVVIQEVTESKQAEEALRKNEERLRLVGRATHDAVWDWDLAANTLWWNENATTLFGCKAEEIEPTIAWWESRIHPEDKARVLSDLQAMFDRGERFLSTEYRFRRGDGSDATVFDRGYVLHDRDGKPVRMIGAMMDITERKRAEEAVKESHERLQRALEASQTGTWRVDFRTGMDTRDASLNRMLGLPSEPSTQPVDDWFLHVHPDDFPAIRSAWEKGLVSGLYDVEHRLVRRDGRVLWVYDRGVMVRDDAGQLLYAIGAAMDITERKRAEEEIRRLNQDLERRVVERTAQLEAVNKELESFSYSVSHDLRAPLRATAGFSRVLLNRYADRLDAQGRDFLQRVDAASLRMGELIEDLLNLSRIARRDMRKEPFDLAALARSIATEIQKADPIRKVTFLIQDHLKAEGDPRLLRIVLENLLGNAWKFTSKRPKATIEFGQVEQEGRPVYFVRDNGAGFDMAYADKLFGAFQRLHSQIEFEGTGIGLATVQRIIHRHGGKVWAEGEIEKGATFFFTL